MDELTALLLAAAEGDRLALAAFVRRTQAEVWRLCASLVDRGAADDLTQDVYLRAMRAAPAFRGDASARTWLLAIARRTCADEIRRRTRGRRLLARAAQPATTTPDSSGPHALRELIDALVPERREAFVLTQVLGLSYAEAAQVADVPIGTIRSRVARAREDLVVALGAPSGPGAVEGG